MRRILTTLLTLSLSTAFALAQAQTGSASGSAANTASQPASQTAAAPQAQPDAASQAATQATAAPQAQPAAQTQAESQSTSDQPQNLQPMMTSGGIVVYGAPAGYSTQPVTQTNQPLVVTPQVTLGTVSTNPVGASSSAYGLQVGASSAAIPSTVPPAPAAGVATEAAVTRNAPGAAGSTTGGVTVEKEIGPVAARPEINANAAASSIGSTNGVSLGELARYNREHATHASRTYTNDDIARLNQNTANVRQSSALPAYDANNGIISQNAPDESAQQNGENARQIPNPQVTQPSGATVALPEADRQNHAQPPATAPKKPAPFTPPMAAPQ